MGEVVRVSVLKHERAKLEIGVNVAVPHHGESIAECACARLAEAGAKHLEGLAGVDKVTQRQR
jgi:hypothetical protein